MAVYDLGRIGILLVEDNSYIRRTLRLVLHQLGVGKIVEARDGAAAIDAMKQMAEDPAFGTAASIDIVLSDLIMSPLDGTLLLRWFRTMDDSPNRFIPFIMISGAADGENVRSARDLGVTEFLAKPFSVESIYKRLIQVIDRPRQMVMTRRYFGPDRRRRKSESEGDGERREITEDDVTIVYSADKVAKPKDDSGVWYFRLPNRLKEIAGGLGASGPGELPAELLAMAEQELEREAQGFTGWALEYLSDLSRHCDEALTDAGDRRKHFDEINLLAHELRGQGGTFGYPLVTVFAKMLYESTLFGCPEDDNAVELAKAHIDALRVVIREDISGDGGEAGKALLASLRQAIDRRRSVK